MQGNNIIRFPVEQTYRRPPHRFQSRTFAEPLDELIDELGGTFQEHTISDIVNRALQIKKEREQ